jgi:hypothetical protein
MTGALILFQEALGKSAQDISITMRSTEQASYGRSTPTLDTLFSTPGVSVQYTIGQGGRCGAGRRSQLNGSLSGSHSISSGRSCSQVAVGDDRPRELALNPKDGIENEEIPQPEKAHE